MTLQSILAAVAVFSLGINGLSAQLAPAPVGIAGRPVLWTVHFDAERLRTGAGKNLFASLDPILNSLTSDNSPVGAKLESFAIFGFQAQKNSGEGLPLLVDLRFSAAAGGITPRFEAVSKKHDVPIETLEGYPAMHFEHEGKEIWLAKYSDSRLLLSSARGLLETALQAGPDALATSALQSPDEVLGGKVEVEPLLATNPALSDSDLLKLLPHLEFHVLSAGEDLDVNAAAELDSDRSAERANKMIAGMLAAISLQDPKGIPWDERLALKQNGPQLTMHLHLDPQEAKEMFDRFAQEIDHQIKPAKHGK